MKLLGVCVLAVLSLAAGTAAGQDAPATGHAGVVVKFSTLGFGFDVVAPVVPRLNVRAGFNLFGLNHDFETDGISLNGQVKMRSVAVRVDWFPTGRSFYVSPGVLLYNGNELSATATVLGGQNFSLGDEDLFSNPANPIGGTANVSYSGAAPMLMFGRGNLLRGERRWSLPFEAGVVFSKAPKASLRLTGSACDPNGLNCRGLASDAGLQRDVADEERQINDGLSVLRIIPVASIGFSYRF